MSRALTLRSLSLSPTRPGPIFLAALPGFPQLSHCPTASRIFTQKHSLISAASSFFSALTPFFQALRCCPASEVFLYFFLNIWRLWFLHLLLPRVINPQEEMKLSFPGSTASRLRVWALSQLPGSNAWLCYLPAVCPSAPESVSRCLAVLSVKER